MLKEQSSLFSELLAMFSKLAVLSDKPEETAENTLRALWHAASGEPMSVELAMQHELRRLDPTSIAVLHALVERRLNGTPLAHLTHRQRFMDCEFITGPDALIPRKETELLTSAALRVVHEITAEKGHAVVIDVCTGIGNIALSIAHREPKTKVYAADLSADAVELARRNATHLHLEDRVSFRHGELFQPFETDPGPCSVDCITCNPPYIATKNCALMPKEISLYEPRLAFDGGPFGVTIFFALFQEAYRFLRPAGRLCFEVGAGQGPALIRRISRSKQYEIQQTHADEHGQIRAVTARALA